MKFQQKLDRIVKKNNSLLCVGLDVDLDKLPKFLLSKNDPIFEFNREIIDATYDLVCCYKPNIAFYEAYGIDGLRSLKKTLEYLQTKYSDIPIILDAKRGDIGNTSKMYAKAIFDYWQVDAVTVFPNLGLDALLPFFAYSDKLIILLVKTSNPDSGTFQNVKVNNHVPYYLHMGKIINKWRYPNIGLFVGATYPDELSRVRSLFPDTPFLSAGIGAQGAKTAEAVRAGVDKYGNNLICNNAREIIYASNGKDFAKKAREKALLIKEEINKWRI